MIFHHLDGPDIVVAYSVGSNAISATEKVGTLDVELVDVFTLILYFTVLRDINTRHSTQYITDGTILLLGETADQVTDGVALLAYAVGLYDNFLQDSCPWFQIYCKRQYGTNKWNRLLFISHHYHFQKSIFSRRQLEGICSVIFCCGKFNDLAAIILYDNGCTDHGIIALSIHDIAAHIGLCHC